MEHQLSEALMDEPVNVVLKFLRAINSHDADAVCSLLTPDSVFIDSLGNRTEDVAKMRPAWEGYFKMVPDYTISHSEILANGDSVALFGSAHGTFSKDGKLQKEDFFTMPAAWRAVVKDGRIALWQIYADNEPVRIVMRKHS